MIKSKITMAIVAALALGYTSAYAQSAQTDTSQQSTDQAPDNTKVKKLEAVTVTGSLIPQTQIETAQPVITITADQLKAKGFTTVAEALQQQSFSTGSVQGSQDTNSFTTGAQTLSLFGLSPSYTKYLINGLPMGNFPGLYNGSDVFNNISGIPADLVDHIDILPGGQSSLYGSDAIAGVINIVLKKQVDAPTVDVRYGWHKDGGGADRRISLADSFNAGKFNSLVGVQFEDTQPIWTGDRSLTAGYNDHGTSPPVAERDYLVLNAYTFGTGASGYLFEDPANCANVAGGFAGTIAKQHRAGDGDYCGSFKAPSYATLTNHDKTANLYTHNTFDVNDNLQLYGDLLYNYEEQKFTNGTSTSFYGSDVDLGYFYDPKLNSLIDIQHVFTPEEVGGYSNIMNTQTENSYMLVLGGKGTFGASNWDYDVSFTHSDDKLLNHDFQRFTVPIENYYGKVLGPQMGTFYGYPQYSPDYSKLYQPISQADFKGFTGYTDSRAKTWDNLSRAQITNSSLFSLPGGDAGMAAVLEAGNEGWNSSPDPRLLETVDYNGLTLPYVYGTSATPGAAHRSREAATAEFRAPLLKQLTLDVSGRYDAYQEPNSPTLSHATYNLGLEYRPLDTLLFRGRYGTAFKVPTLSDTGQGVSNFYSFVTDYANCATLGYTGANVVNCPARYNSVQYKGTTYGVPGLKPITAKVWSYGAVWAPIQDMSFSVDYLHYNINNEVTPQSADQLSKDEYLCMAGVIDPTTPTCTQAFAQIQRSPGAGGLLGNITGIIQPKINTANEIDNALIARFSYGFGIGALGRLVVDSSYSDVLKHNSQQYVGDARVNLLTNPAYSTDFKTKVNASLTWTKSEWSATAYVNRYGSTPNYLATYYNNYTSPGTGKLGAWIVWNASVTYNPTKNLGLSFLVNNVFNKMPPVDNSYPGTVSGPYNTDDYNVFGRAMFVEANYKFGSGG
ncbi:TonB-dependent receptor [Rhodanobacter sp. C05]|uniref:TonB-dependent receptor domain-containing protein n=1 Tax=Rhodanobacter sp. C05 TaxID=1945855 RepID=UPI000984619C|nr:TonB-dependent receptor [Rhodanobacter sp. C05]